MGTYIGLDAHMRTCTYTAKNEKNETIDSGTFPSTREDLKRFAKKFPKATVVIEASSVHEWIYDCLKEHGMTMFAAHPINIQRVLGKKNDEIDSDFLVDAFRIGALPRAYVPPPDIRDLRQLARHRSFIVKERSRLKHRVMGILNRKGIRIIDPTTGEEPDSVFLLRVRKELLKIDDAEIPVLLSLIDALHEKANASELRLNKAAAANPAVRQLMTIPGFGPYVAIGVYAEIGDITRFPNADALASYFGLVPSEAQSGEKTRRGHITRHGSELVRMLLNQAAWTHLRVADKSSFSKQHKRLAKRTGKKRAVVALERKLVKCAYWVLKENREFRMNG